MQFSHAILRTPGDPASGLTTATLGAPDKELSLRQFDAYAQTLRDFGLQIDILPPLPGFGDAHYVEDTAVVMPEGAIITHPGAPARQGEVESVASALAAYRSLHRMSEAGTMDGGDVLLVGKQFFIGETSRTNQAGISEFARIVEAWGYTVQSIEVGAGLHLKSIVNYVGKNTMTVSEDAARNPAFASFNHIVLAPEEEYAGNTLWINDRLITPAGYPKTLAALQALDLPITVLDTSEFRKMDGGLTCLSLRF
ncbi:amidinotransferase [Massilia sp. W12]|uniref:dimethylarginine dimethylaminohydrolase family protein n=1 Tax=Massilia sp. W12 TaxID=3126507 RepID=UPI0030D0B6DB